MTYRYDPKRPDLPRLMYADYSVWSKGYTIKMEYISYCSECRFHKIENKIHVCIREMIDKSANVIETYPKIPLWCDLSAPNSDGTRLALTVPLVFDKQEDEIYRKSLYDYNPPHPELQVDDKNIMGVVNVSD